MTFNTKFASMSKSHVTGGWLSQPVLSCPLGVNARIPLLLQWPNKESIQEVIAWVWEDLSVTGTQSNSTLGLSVFSVGLWFLKAWRMVAACLGGVHRGGAAPGVPSTQASEVGMPCCQGTQCWVVSSHSRFGQLLLGTCSVLGPSEGGIVYGLFSKEALYIGKASVSRTHSPGLAARLTEHIRCLHRPGLKDGNKPRYRLLLRKLWGVRFFLQAVFPTISQTLAAEALAISMEAPMGNARNAAEERRLRRKGEKAKVRAPRRRPSSRRTVGEHLGLFGCQRSTLKSVPSQTSSLSMCAGAGHSFFSSLHNS